MALLVVTILMAGFDFAIMALAGAEPPAIAGAMAAPGGVMVAPGTMAGAAAAGAAIEGALPIMRGACASPVAAAPVGDSVIFGLSVGEDLQAENVSGMVASAMSTIFMADLLCWSFCWLVVGCWSVGLTRGTGARWGSRR